MRQNMARAELPGQDGGRIALGDSTVVAVLEVGADGAVQAANRTMRQLLGAPSARAIVGMNLRDLLLDPGDWRAWETVLATGAARAVTLRLRKPQGAELLLRGDLLARESGNAQPGRAVIGVFLDATREQQLTRAVQQSARMEALGSLTAGIAHDFNNLLTILVGNLSLVAEEVRSSDRVFAKIKPARDAAKRGAELIRQLLGFARREDGEVGVIDAGRVVAEIEPLLRRALGARVDLEARIEAGQWPVRASAAQLESVIVNLAMNSRDAITGKGKLTVAVGEPRGGPDGDGRVGGQRCVAVSVADDGGGIPAELLERVFEPFFSTKGERGGTGLGLSMVRWFAEGASGSVRIASTVGEGTRVTVLLPLAADAHVDPNAGTVPLSTLPAGQERVLLLAADEALRATITQILEVLGYTVRAIADAGVLPSVLQGYAADLLILDAQLCGRARPAWLDDALMGCPSLKLIVTADGAPPDFTRALGAGALPKPFSLADLAKTVRSTLDG